jgi:uncharacterized protein (TIGR02001 family)
MKRIACTVVGSLSLAIAAESHADETTKQWTANVGVYSNYVFRGLTQTNERPAIQGGFDYAHPAGFYAGTWLSNVSWFSDTNPGNSASLEVDLYGGFKRSWANGLTSDLGYIRYQYPGDYRQLPLGTVKPHSNEVYAGLSWKWLSLKYSYAIDDLFGVEDSGGTQYLDFSASVPLADHVTLGLHAGTQQYEGASAAARLAGTTNDALYSYEDYRSTLTYVFGGNWTAAATYTHSTAKDAGYTVLGRNLGDDQFVISAARTF